jgi:hypothetical protein
MTRRTALFVWASMLLVPFAFAGVAFRGARAVVVPELVEPLFWGALLVAAGNVALARALPPRLHPPRAHGAEAMAFTRVLTSLALCEAGAIAPLVAYMLTNDARLLGVVAASVLALVLLFPTDRRWAALLPRRQPALTPGVH